MNRVYEADIEEELELTVYETEAKITTEKKTNYLVTYICGSFSMVFLIISISLFVYSRKLK